MMMTAKLGVTLRIALVALACCCTAAPLAAQTANETSAMADRLNRLETQLNQLQRQVYSGGNVPPAQRGAPSSSSSAGFSGNPDAVANFGARLDEFESRLSDLNGRIEEVDHQNKVLQERLEKLIADVDFRFKALEKGGNPAPDQAANQAPPPADQSAAGAANDSDGSTLGKPPGVLGTLRTDTPPDQQQAAVAPPPPSAPAPVKLPPGSVQSQYNFATDLLHQGDYAGAEQALAEFIHQHPNDPLASAAQYWLGETFFVRQKYDRAAKAFLAGYQKYPKTQKAPDDLLKLAMSLTALNQKKEACAVFQQLAAEYPSAEPRIKQSAAREKPKASCH